MLLPLKLNDAIDALETTGEELAYYVDRTTGEIVMITTRRWRRPKRINSFGNTPIGSEK